MDLAQSFLDSIRESPDDPSLWLILADWLEDRADPRAELVRLTQSLRAEPDHPEFDARQRRVQALLAGGVPPLVPAFTNSVGMELALIPAGSFIMGSSDSEEGRRPFEPLHPVTITRPFYLGIYPVTQAEYGKVVGTNPAHFTRARGGGPNFPVENINWHEAVNFCELLSGLPAERSAGRTYRLPTEAEWEYACRAGTTTVFHFGPSISAREANFNTEAPYGGPAPERSLRRTTPVGSYPPNAWGLYDMHGNVVNWCQDWYSHLKDKRAVDPVGPRSARRDLGYRLVRGGSWSFHGQYCRAAYRNHASPDSPREFYGVRVACVLL
jgi:uncharacterized protein (TIGR02996 family)